MNNKNILIWILIILISLALTLTTFTPNYSKKNQTININSFNISEDELNNFFIKAKNKYKNLNKITDINKKLEILFKKNIEFNLNIKKIGLICSDKEILYTIIKSNFFKKNNIFSLDSYTKYLKINNINENLLQRKIKNFSEKQQILKNKTKKNTIIKKESLLKLNKSISKNKIKKNYKNNLYYDLTKISYINISIRNLINKFEINNNHYQEFEKQNIKKYFLPKIIKIKYLIHKNKNYIKTKISKNEINPKIFKLLNNNKYIKKNIKLKNFKNNLQIKNLKKIKQKINKISYKKDMLNKYKKTQVENIIKKSFNLIKKNKNNNFHEIKKILKLKIKNKFFSYRIKSDILSKINKIKNKKTNFLINKIETKKIKSKIKNKNILNIYENNKINKYIFINNYILKNI